jgi:LPXTG-site transpeptidase (sortase) family protein
MLPILPKIDTTTQVNALQGSKALLKKAVIVTKSPVNRKDSSLPKIFFVISLILITSQVIPLAWSIFLGWKLSNNNGTYMPISAIFLSKLSSVSYTEPGADYLTAVVAQNQTPVIDQDYSKQLKITIPSAGISNINLGTNVPGNKPELYDEVLKHGVAHLKGTSVPGDIGTTVIYGHSGVAGLLAKSNPQIVFSRLDTVSIGDTMSIERDGKELNYVVSGKKIVDPQNLTFMGDQDTKERAILLTCWPLGIGTKRLIVIADRIL